jgi:hypothetical protein
MNTDRLDIDQAIDQLINYCYPKGIWLGTSYMNTNVIYAMMQALKDARAAQLREEQIDKDKANKIYG